MADDYRPQQKLSQDDLEDLYRFLDNEMDAEEALEFEQRIENDELLERAMENELELREKMRQLYVDDLAEAQERDAGAEIDRALDRALADAENEADDGDGEGRFRLGRWASVAAAVLLAGVIWLGYTGISSDPVNARLLMGEIALSFSDYEDSGTLEHEPSSADADLRVEFPAGYRTHAVHTVSLSGDLMQSLLGERQSLNSLPATRVTLRKSDGDYEALYIMSRDKVRLDGLREMPFTYTCPITGERTVLWKSSDLLMVMVSGREYSQILDTVEKIRVKR